MTVDQREREELHDLLWSMDSGAISTSDVDRLDRIVCGNLESLRLYAKYVRLLSDLRFGATNSRTEATLAKLFGIDDLPHEEVQGNIENGGGQPSGGHFVLDLDSPAQSPADFTPSIPLGSHYPAIHGMAGYIPEGMPFAYLVATVVLGIGIFLASFIHVTRSVQIAEPPPSVANGRAATGSQMEFVGRISGMADCQWADPSTATIPGAYVPLGRKYAISSGVMEIAYDTGAKVILQGPVTYEAESPAGGYLSFGKLTARVEKREEKSPNLQISKSPNLSLSTIHYPLFTIKTPTAIVTDLGTEFGVEVDKQGRTDSHVFQGMVEVRVARSGGNQDDVVVLHERESVRVEPDANISLALRRIVPNPEAFVHRLVPPRRVPIEVFNTGIGLAEGQPDPHWQIVAASDDPGFSPRPALVSPSVSWLNWLDNEPVRSQWISIVGDGSAVPNGLTYTFRTTFDLGAVRPTGRVLNVQFIADSCVRAIRFNGRELRVPEHGVLPPYDAFHPFQITHGFVEGTNVLEFDVENVNETSPDQLSADRMGLRVELEGTVIQQQVEMQRGQGSGK